MAAASDYLGTSHRQARVRFEVGALRNGLAELFAAPRRLRDPAGQRRHDGVLGRGVLRADRSAEPAPPLRRVLVEVRRGGARPRRTWRSRRFLWADPGSHPLPVADAEIDAYCLTHNETSTGVAMPIERPSGADGLVLVDATSAAGGLRVDLAETDVYYFAPQKCLAADGGLWLAAVSPARSNGSSGSPRRDGGARRSSTCASPSSRAGSTRPTTHRRWRRSSSPRSRSSGSASNGGLEWAAGRCDRSAAILYELGRGPRAGDAVREGPGDAVARRRHDRLRRPGRCQRRSPRCSGPTASSTPSRYRKLGRNQLRIALFPAIDPDDVAQLTRCIDLVLATGFRT